MNSKSSLSLGTAMLAGSLVLVSATYVHAEPRSGMVLRQNVQRFTIPASPRVDITRVARDKSTEGSGKVGVKPGNTGSTEGSGKVDVKPGNTGSTEGSGKVDVKPGNTGSTEGSGKVGVQPASIESTEGSG